MSNVLIMVVPLHARNIIKSAIYRFVEHVIPCVVHVGKILLYILDFKSKYIYLHEWSVCT